ncbi:phage tail protein, partial [Salmonella enterica subsp. enterica serovar Anatum]|nr:phage tail protein [Salmonella enterica subsp. enterica serovar Anatum]
GTGPYEVVENNGFHLQMKAFDHYFGLRGLLDEVEVFIWPNLTATTELNRLREAMTAHQAMALVFGNGDYRGWFVITDLTATHQHT